jgi:hypothetical protein
VFFPGRSFTVLAETFLDKRVTSEQAAASWLQETRVQLNSNPDVFSVILDWFVFSLFVLLFAVFFFFGQLTQVLILFLILGRYRYGRLFIPPNVSPAQVHFEGKTVYNLPVGVLEDLEHLVDQHHKPVPHSPHCKVPYIESTCINCVVCSFFGLRCLSRIPVVEIPSPIQVSCTWLWNLP